MTPDLKPSEVLDRAADLVAGPGCWTQGRFGFNDATPHCGCIVGALLKSGGEVGDAAWRFVNRALGMPKFEFLADWNDHPSRQQSEVVDALRKAAELARGEGA